jgi:hypothetical protein
LDLVTVFQSTAWSSSKDAERRFAGLPPFGISHQARSHLCRRGENRSAVIEVLSGE